MSLLEDHATVVPNDDNTPPLTDGGVYHVALDAAGPIRSLSSDVLHALFYLNPGMFLLQILLLLLRASWICARDCLMSLLV